jgi:DNA-binding CsgD family transcriptional regulator
MVMNEQIDEQMMADNIADCLMQGLTPSEIKMKLNISSSKYLFLVGHLLRLNGVFKTQSEIIKEIESELFIYLEEYQINPSELINKRIESLKSRYTTINYYN